MANHEKDFLYSYKGHMEHVSRELKKYKMICDERQFLIKRDARVEKLQAQTEYFKKEAQEQHITNVELQTKLKLVVKKLTVFTQENETLLKSLMNQKKKYDALEKAYVAIQ